MLFLIVLSAVLLAVVVFALQNAQVVTARFLSWELQSSLALITVGATTAGLLIAALVGLTSRVCRWNRGRSATEALHPSIGAPPVNPAIDDRTPGWNKVQ